MKHARVTGERLKAQDYPQRLRRPTKEVYKAFREAEIAARLELIDFDWEYKYLEAEGTNIKSQ